MKKNIVKAVSLALSVIAATSVFTGCGENNSDPTVLQINWTIGGYGREYCKPLMNAFTEKTGIKCEETYDDNSASIIASKIGSVKRNTIDLFFTQVPLFSSIAAQKNKNGYENLYLELSDLYNEKVPGTNVTLKEHLKDGMWEAQLTDDGKAYTVPWIAPMDGLVYNKKVLDSFGITKLPRTTDEFESVLKQIKSGLSSKGEPVTTENGGTISGLISANNSAYWAFVWPTWWAQYEGMDNVRNYFMAKTPDAGENYVPDWNALKQDGKLIAIEELNRFINKIKGYMHPDSLNRDNIFSQIDFLDGKVAFIPTGDWMENESAKAYRDKGIDIDVRFMKTPVTSRLAVKLGITENELRAAIDYVDAISEGKTADAPVYEGKNTAEQESITKTISEARLLVSSSQAALDRAVIPAYSDNIDGAKQFLLFFASDEGQKIMAKYSGASSAFKYKMSEEDKSEFSTLTRSALDICERNGVSYWIDDIKYPIRYKANLLITYWNAINYQRGFEEVLYNNSKTPNQVYDTDWGSYRDCWDRMLSQAGY